MERYDIAIIGTGPAGLSAAVTATIRNKKVLLLGTRDPIAKVYKAHTIINYLGLPSVSGEYFSISAMIFSRRSRGSRRHSRSVAQM